MNHRIEMRRGWAIELDGEEDEITLVDPAGERALFTWFGGLLPSLASCIRAQQEQPVTDGDVD